MNKKVIVKEYLIAGILFTLSIFTFLILTGTITSGLHLVDDHEFYTKSVKLKESGFWECLVYYVRADLGIRFRPFYQFARVLGVSIFGTNSVLWAICKALEISLSMTFLYTFARLMDVNRFFSTLFAILILTGEQSAVWWRFGPPESLGMLLFSAGMLVTYHLSKKRNVFSVLGFIVILIALSMQKESFCVSIPGFFLLLLALESRGVTKETWKKMLGGFIKRHLLEIVVLTVVFIIEVYMITFVVGVDKIDYAGFHQETSIVEYVIGILVNMKHWCFPYLLMTIGMPLLAQIEFKRSDIAKAEIVEIVFFMYIFTVEQICHAKSGMSERYLLPWVVCICYFVIINGYRIIKNNKRVQIAMGGMLLIFVFYFTSLAASKAQDFSDEGKDLWKCIDYVVNNTENMDSIIAVTRVLELDMAFDVIMKYEYGYYNCDTIDNYEDNIIEIGEADILFGRPGQVYYRISEEAGLSLDDYNFFVTDYYEVGIAKEK